MKSDEESARRMLDDLRRQVEMAISCFDSGTMKEATPAEEAAFLREHTRSHMVVGDFEITCLSPGKYGME